MIISLVQLAVNSWFLPFLQTPVPFGVSFYSPCRVTTARVARKAAGELEQREGASRNAIVVRPDMVSLAGSSSLNKTIP
jgi:hypothetical protein